MINCYYFTARSEDLRSGDRGGSPMIDGCLEPPRGDDPSALTRVSQIFEIWWWRELLMNPRPGDPFIDLKENRFLYGGECGVEWSQFCFVDILFEIVAGAHHAS